MEQESIGRRIMAELQGPDYMPKKDKLRNDFNDALQDYAEEVCFGRIWARDGIDRKQRSIINIAMLVALNRRGPLKNHINGALNNGCTVGELKEILLQTAVYCGLPAATEAFQLAEEVLRERGLLA